MENDSQEQAPIMQAQVVDLTSSVNRSQLHISMPVDTVAAKKRKTEKLSFVRAQWNTARIEVLLNCRYSIVAKNKYHSTKTNKQKAAFWLWLTNRFNAKVGVLFEAEQVKRRIRALLAEWRALQRAESETGNSTADNINYPEYYETMVSTMQVVKINFIVLIFHIKHEYSIESDFCKCMIDQLVVVRSARA